jgi:hypothetical protein
LVAILLTILLAPAERCSGQAIPTLSDDAYVSVLTILPGSPLYSAFGHTAIRVRDDSLGIDLVYNFGTFDFNTDWFYFKFARGLLDYRLARNRFEDVLTAYTEEKRPIIEQRLDLDKGEIQSFVLRLETNYLPENRYYRYDFFFDNCSTRPRDVIENAVGRHTLGSKEPSESTFRELIEPYIVPRPWTDFGIDVALGSRTDRPATLRQRLFLPDELMAALDTTNIGSQPIVLVTDTLFWPRGYERMHGSPLFGPLLVMLLLLVYGGAIAFTNVRRHVAARYFDAALLIFAGLAGLVIVFLWFGTQHTVTRDNWNLLWALPTHLVAAALLLKRVGGSALRIYFAVSAVLAGLVAVVWLLDLQDFHGAIVPLVALLVLRLVDRARNRRPP